MALPAQAGYAARQAAGPRNNSGWSFFANHGLPALGAGADVALPPLLARLSGNGQQQQVGGATGLQGALEGPKVQPAMGQPAMGPNNQVAQQEPQGMDNLSSILQQLIGHKTDQMMGGMGGMQPTNPQRWQQQANQAVEQQQGQQGPPQWNPQTGGFSFNEFLTENNPLQGLGDEGSGSQQANQDENKSGWRKAANVAGKFASTAAPVAAMFGPWGMAAGAGLGALGYLGQKA